MTDDEVKEALVKLVDLPRAGGTNVETRDDGPWCVRFANQTYLDGDGELFTLIRYDKDWKLKVVRKFKVVRTAVITEVEP